MKRKNVKRILTLGLAATLAVGALSACGDDKKVAEYKGEDIMALYADNDEQFEFFAYRTLTDGYYYVDGQPYFTRNLRTEADYKQYFDAGFTMLYLSPGYNGIDNWETCTTKQAWNEALAAGAERIFFADGRLTSLIDSGEELAKLYPKDELDENGGFVLDEEKLTAYVKDCLSTYFNEKAFYGLNLGDEPSYKYAESYGIIYKAVKKAAKQLTEEIGAENIQNALGAEGDPYLHVNFLPIDSGGLRSERFQTYKTDENGNEVLDAEGKKVVLTFTESYTKYVEDYIFAMEPDRISVDIYYFRGTGISPGSYACVQILANLCKKHDIALSFCLQSFEMYSGKGTTPIYRKVDKSDMRMEMESLIAFGVDHFAYYTYATDVENSSDGTRSVEGSAFVDYSGNPTNVYYWAQELMADAKKFEKVVLSYDYQGARMYQTQTQATFSTGAYFASAIEPTSGTSIQYDNSHEFAKLKNVSFDNDVLFVSELKDGKNDKYMYFVQNCIDPANSKLGRTAQNVTVEFGDEFTWVAEFDGGDLTYVKLEKGKYEKTLSAGYGVFLIPLA